MRVKVKRIVRKARPIPCCWHCLREATVRYELWVDGRPEGDYCKSCIETAKGKLR